MSVSEVCAADQIMDLSRSRQEHRLPGSPSTSLTRGSVQAVQSREGRATQRCYYAIFLLFFLGLLLVSIACFTLVIIREAELDNTTNLSFLDRCILFVDKTSTDNYHAGAWACDFVLGADFIVILVTVFMFVLYIVFVVTGTKILSGCRVLDMVVFICLAVLSCAVGIILRLGIEQTCNSNSDCKQNESFITTSEYLSFGVAGAYLVFFIFKLTMVVGFCACSGRRQSSSYETTPLLNTGPNVYSSVRFMPGQSNPFQDDAHV